MKSLFFVAFCLQCFLLSGQVISRDDDGGVMFSRVIEVSETSKDDLYSRARSWFVDNFRDANAVIQFDDKDLGKIQGKGISKYPVWRPGGIHANFTVLVLVKDGKAKISAYGISYEVKTFGNTETTFANEIFKEGKYLKKDGSMKAYPKVLYDATILGMGVTFDSFEDAIKKGKDEFSF